MLRSEMDDDFQITIPDAVVEALGLRPGKDSLRWDIRGGEVIVRRAPQPEEREDSRPRKPES